MKSIPTNWIRLRTFLQGWERKYGVKHWLFQSASEHFGFDTSDWWVFLRLVVVLLVGLGADRLNHGPVVVSTAVAIVVPLVAILMIVDVLAVNTSIAFTSQNPVMPLRTSVLALLAFFTLAVAFAAIFMVLPSRSFKEPLHLVSAIYFSMITLATVGYGDIYPISRAARCLVVVEVLVGLYFLLVLFAIFASWANEKSKGTEADPQREDPSHL